MINNSFFRGSVHPQHPQGWDCSARPRGQEGGHPVCLVRQAGQVILKNASKYCFNLSINEINNIVFADKMPNGEKADLNVRDQELMTNFIKRHQETSKLW